MGQRVVVTGLGTINPCGQDVASTWRSLLDGRSGIGPITRFDASQFAVRIAGEVKEFDPTQRIDERDAKRVGRFANLALWAADEAMSHAGFVRGEVWPDPDRFGVYLGSGVGGLPELVEGAFTVRDEGPRRLSPFVLPRSLVNLAAGQVAIRYTARGPSLCVSTACASANQSIGEAWSLLRTGEVDVVLAGGCEASISPLGIGGFMAMKALSRRNDAPIEASRPFDRERDGFVMGEGAGVLVLERLEHAQARGAHILAEIVGFGASTDAYHITSPSEDGQGAARAMERALRSAGLAPEAVQHINAHGTGTAANDRIETVAIRRLFGAHAEKIAISATKSLTGHLLGAAGGLEAIATVMALQTGVVPGTANLTNPDPECDLDYVTEGARRCRPAVALSNGFGFGGTNTALAFRRWEG